MATAGVTADGRARVLADGNEIPLLALGVWQVPDGPECENAVRWALELGYRHIDTAQAYGNEASVGRALRDSGVPRDEVFITTKFYPDRKDPEAEVQRSLERLGVDQVDLYIIHWPAGGPRWAWPGMERARARLRTLDRRLELQPRRARPAARGRQDATGHQPGPVQPVRVPPTAAPGLRGAQRRARGLQPAGHGPPSPRPARPPGRRARRAYAGPGSSALVPAAQPGRPAEVHPPRADRRERSHLRLHALPADMAALDALDKTGGTDRALEHTWW